MYLSFNPETVSRRVSEYGIPIRRSGKYPEQELRSLIEILERWQ